MHDCMDLGLLLDERRPFGTLRFSVFSISSRPSRSLGEWSGLGLLDVRLLLVIGLMLLSDARLQLLVGHRRGSSAGGSSAGGSLGGW